MQWCPEPQETLWCFPHTADIYFCWKDICMAVTIKCVVLCLSHFQQSAKKCWLCWLSQSEQFQKRTCCRRADVFLLPSACTCKLYIIATCIHHNKSPIGCLAPWKFCCDVSAEKGCCVASLIARSACWANFKASAELSKLLLSAIVWGARVSWARTCLHLLLWLQQHI